MMLTDLRIIDFLAIPAFVLDVDEFENTTYAAVNAAWCDGTTRKPEDVIGKTAKEVFAGRFGIDAYAHQLAVVKSREKSCFELPLPLSENIHFIQTRLTPVLNDAGDVVRIVGTSFDKTAELLAQNMLANAATANTEFEDFIAMAAHDLRAPMRNVGAISNMLREDFADLGDGKLELINILEKVATKATSLISDLLAHAQAANTVETQETFDLFDLCEDIFVVLDPTKRHALTAPHQFMTTDKAAVQVAIRNLCDNAIKHSDRSNIRLHVEVETIAQNMIQFSITDNGHGFADPAVAFLDGGKFKTDSGFGLLGVRKLINARGGQIYAENLSDEQGGVVHFSLFGSLSASDAPVSASVTASPMPTPSA